MNENEQANMKKRIAARMRAMQIEQQKREIAKKYMTPEAYERMMNVRISNQELYMQIIDLIISMVQSGRVNSKINEAQLKDILARVTYKEEPTITFQHK